MTIAVRAVYTWTQRGNDGMRTLNTRLGFATRTQSLTMHASLPLSVQQAAPDVQPGRDDKAG